ncbi:MAG: LPP20 family lipoprotein [Acidobacteria bacterium]|nr:LPP20 family lipoprotein [Acidobacteriota bacterium]
MRPLSCRRPYLIPVFLLSLLAFSSSLDAQPRSRGQQTILAFEAARADAYRNLLESVQGLRVEGGTTVRNLAVESSETRTQLEEFIRGAAVVDESIESDGAARVTVELDLDRLERLLGRNLPDGVRRIRVDGFGAPASPVAPQGPAGGAQPAAGVQSAVVGSPFAWNQEPDGPPAFLSSTVTVTGSAAQDLGRVRSAAQARLLAERAAVNDGYRRLLEYVYGISVSSTTTVRDLVLSSDRVDSEVSGFIRGARVVDVRHRPDGIAEADMSLDLSDLERIINW